MRLSLLLTLFLALTGCTQLASYFMSAEDPAKIKARVMKVVEERRAKQEWMQRESCPSDFVPRALRRPRLVAKDCSANPAYCLSKCDGGEADSCFALAQLIQEYDTIENDVADVLYREACQLGIVSGCTNAAAHLFESSDKNSLSCGARTFDLSCAREDPWACTMSGLSAMDGIGREKSKSDALQYFERACEVAVDKNGEPCMRAKELKARITNNN